MPSRHASPPDRAPQRALYSVWALMLLIPVAAQYALIQIFGVRFPLKDQWELVPDIEKLHNGTLTLADLWAQHNEHRILFPRIVMLILASVTHWKTMAEMTASLAIAVGSFVLLCLMLRRTFRGLALWAYAAATIPLAWLFFSAGQWENWTWGWQVQWFMSIFGLVLMVWTLTSWPARLRSPFRLPVAIAAAVLATYSLGNGMLSWAAGLLIMLLHRDTRRAIIVWCAAAVVTAATYLYHYRDPDPSSKTLWLHQPLGFLKYFFTYLGGAAGFATEHVAIFVGLLLFAVFVAAVAYLVVTNFDRLRELAAWLALALYAMASAALGGIARLNLGIKEAASSRYTTVSVLFFIATLVLVAVAGYSLYQRFPRWRVFNLFAATLIAIFVVIDITFGYAWGIEKMVELKQNLAATPNCIHTATSDQPNCLLKAYPVKSIVYPRIQYLRSIHWGGF